MDQQGFYAELNHTPPGLQLGCHLGLNLKLQCTKRVYNASVLADTKSLECLSFRRVP